MLTSAEGGDQTVDVPSLKFFAAVARQCFINEYVYALPQSEADRARDLQLKLAGALRDGEPVPPLWPIAIAAYFPLHTTAGAQALLEQSWPDYVRDVLVQQIEEPMREREIAAAIPALTAIEDNVSRAVRAQYEENPYPRWIEAGPPVQPIILKGTPPEQVPDVLVAGCGTGLSTIEFARQMRHAIRFRRRVWGLAPSRRSMGRLEDSAVAAAAGRGHAGRALQRDRAPKCRRGA
jgi:hypothetical protein